MEAHGEIGAELLLLISLSCSSNPISIKRSASYIDFELTLPTQLQLTHLNTANTRLDPNTAHDAHNQQRRSVDGRESLEGRWLGRGSVMVIKGWRSTGKGWRRLSVIVNLK
ncbi:uncharacterized protein LOC130778162 [Actinidia eriantha]|uniref:uncharacterized protein LOC130778162 n=1 Tax=Actinidia eriantha TaxID=165200 RepID=UPI00258A6250|nr:uncharacterized protein LOC130778162 [Actinidia eriantha]